MASKYLRSGAGGAGTGADWANAYTTITAAMSGMSAGDVLYVSEDHSESTAGAVTITPPGTASNPIKIICVNHSGSVPPVSADLRTTAIVATTGANSINFGAGTAYIYGVTFSAGSVANAAGLAFTATTDWFYYLDSCILKVNTTNTGTTARVTVGASGGGNMKAVFNNVILQFGATAQGISVNNCQFVWQNTSSALAGTAPTTLFLIPATNPRLVDITLRGLDLSALGSSNILNAAFSVLTKFNIFNCKLGSSFSYSTGNIVSPSNLQGTYPNNDSGNTNYKYRKQVYEGTIDQETTIVRSGGASDGTTSHSRKMVSSANSRFYDPLVSDPIVYWNESTSSITVTIEVITDNVTLKDNEAWIIVDELGTSSFPQSVRQVDRAADILNTGTNQTTSSETWTTTGLTTPVTQKLSVTFTPASKGPLRIQVALAKASTTMYFCPKPTVA